MNAPLTLPLEVGAKLMDAATLCPGANVDGSAMPETLKPAPVTESCEIVTLVPPELVSVVVSACVLPTVTLPKLKLAGLALSCPGAAPEPASATFSAPLVAFDASVNAPLALPLEVGANVIDAATLCPGASVAGPTPLTLNPGPLTAADVTATLIEPVFVMVMGCVWLLPTIVLPKFTADGLAFKYPSTPVPESEIALLLWRVLPLFPMPEPSTSVKVPLALPAACGANDT